MKAQRNPKHHRPISIELAGVALTKAEETALRPTLDAWAEHNKLRQTASKTKELFERKLKSLQKSLRALESDIDALASTDVRRLQNDLVAGWSNQNPRKAAGVPWDMERSLPQLRAKLREVGPGLEAFGRLGTAGGRHSEFWRFLFTRQAWNDLQVAGLKEGWEISFSRFEAVLPIILERVGEPPQSEYLLRQLRKAERSESRRHAQAAADWENEDQAARRQRRKPLPR